MYNHLGIYLKTKRISKGLTQAELAAKLDDVHSQFVSNWERGLCYPPKHCFKKLKTILGLREGDTMTALMDDAYANIREEYKGLL